MPNMDGTGPNGMGPMTGRGMGQCGRGVRGNFGRGRGAGRGLGRGMGCGIGRMAGGVGYVAANGDLPYQPTKKEYIQMLKDEMTDIKSEIDELEK